MFLRSKFSRRLVGLCLISTLAVGCSSQARLEDVVVFGNSSLQSALQERLERFNRARYWGGLSETVAFVKPNYQRQFVEAERGNTDIQRMVRSDVTHVELSPDGKSADVQIEVRYFEKPTYLVRTRTEEQTWAYNRFGGGWLLTELNKKDEGKIHESGPQQGRGMPSRSPYEF